MFKFKFYLLTKQIKPRFKKWSLISVFLLNGVSDFSKYSIELIIYGVILIMIKKNVVCHHILLSDSFAFLWSLQHHLPLLSNYCSLVWTCDWLNNDLRWTLINESYPSCLTHPIVWWTQGHVLWNWLFHKTVKQTKKIRKELPHLPMRSCLWGKYSPSEKL